MSNKPNISVVSHNDCCGCKACGDVCPKSCISFEKDSEGFFYPSVDENLCTNCGLCSKICPELSVKGHDVADKSYAGYALSEQSRHDGSSGGIFGLLAKLVIEKGGIVVGAAFDEKMTLKHHTSSSIEELKPLFKSKYIQSDTEGIYKTVLSFLKAGKTVLFSGTPCQCNAIANVCYGFDQNLILVEVVCHGVPSQDLFNKCIDYESRQRSMVIDSFTFRAKYKNALHPQAFSMAGIENGKRKTINGLHYQSPYYFGFQKYITLRPSCYNCKQANPQRCADITLGDFWGIEKIVPRFNAKEGVSMIIPNTEKGQELIDTLIDHKLIVFEVLSIEDAFENNGNLVHPTKLSQQREFFFKALKENPFENVVGEFLIPKRKWIFDLYYGMPKPLRQIVRKLMDKRMRYE